MYRAIHQPTGDEIIILQPRWKGRLDDLRGMDRADALVCPGCGQPVRVKAGAMKRPHFAHKHLQACSLGSESPEILNARAVLFELLHSRFGDSVSVEQMPEGVELPRPFDCWVRIDNQSFGYWIVEAGIKLEPRDAIRAGFAKLVEEGILRGIHILFLHAMLTEERKEFHSLLLTPTERAFLRTTPYDTALAGITEPGGTMHYLDADTPGGVLTTYRNLRLHHKPNWYKGVKKTVPLDDLRVSPVDGSFVYPGELERMAKLRQKQQKAQARAASYQHQQVDQRPPPAPRKWSPHAETRETPTLECATCGRVTTDYWSTFYDEQGRPFCRCRACLDQEE